MTGRPALNGRNESKPDGRFGWKLDIRTPGALDVLGLVLELGQHHFPVLLELGDSLGAGLLRIAVHGLY